MMYSTTPNTTPESSYEGICSCSLYETIMRMQWWCSTETDAAVCDPRRNFQRWSKGIWIEPGGQADLP